MFFSSSLSYSAPQQWIKKKKIQKQGKGKKNKGSDQ